MPVAPVTRTTAQPSSTNRIHYAITAAQVAQLPEEQRNTFKLLAGLARGQDVKGIAELKRWAGVGNPAGLPAGHEAIGPETLARLAAAFRKAGHPLTTAHVNAFKANRHLSGGSELGPTTARALLEEVGASLCQHACPGIGCVRCNAERSIHYKRRNHSWTRAARTTTVA